MVNEFFYLIKIEYHSIFIDTHKPIVISKHYDVSNCRKNYHLIGMKLNLVKNYQFLVEQFFNFIKIHSKLLKIRYFSLFQ